MTLISSQVKVASTALAVILTATTLGVMPAVAKRVSFHLPPQSKLMDGAGPQDSKVQDEKAAAARSASIDLSPVGLNSDESKPTAGDRDADGNPLLKTSVRENKYLAGDGSGTAGSAKADGKSESIVKSGQLGDKILSEKDKAPKVEVGPLALRESDDEAKLKADTRDDIEKRQLAELWQSAVETNPDIQFVMTKLQPNSDQAHALAKTMQLVGGILCGAVNASSLMFMGPGGSNVGGLMASSAGASLLQQVLSNQDMKNAKKFQISQEQAIMLYTIVRTTAEKVVGNYRDFKKHMNSLARAQSDYQELQSMVAEARVAQDAAKQVEMEYTLRKARRDIDKEAEDVRRVRQELADLSGAEAVLKLDKQFSEEQIALEKLTAPTAEATGESVFVNPLSPPVTNIGTAGRQTAATEGAVIH